MKQFPIAIQLFSVRGDLEKDFEGTLKQIKALGYDGVEIKLTEVSDTCL